jgi:hypothetical protein
MVSLRRPGAVGVLPAQAHLSIEAPSGSGPTYWLGSAAPWVLPKVWPPAMRATVSSSFIAMRANVSRMSRAEASALGVPLGPSGLT